MKLYLARHGETEENLAGILAGQLPGSLSPTGIAQAQELGALLPRLNPFIIVTSDLHRAHLTSTIAAYAGGYTGNIIPDPRLREVHLGDFQGKKEQEVKVSCQQRGLPEYGTLIHSDIRYFLAEEREPLVRSFSCEPTSHIDERLEQVIKDIIRPHAQQLGEKEGLLLVSHLAFNSYLVEKLLYGTCGINLKKRSEGGHYHQGNNELFAIDFSKDGEVTKVQLNIPYAEVQVL